jgi:integrase
LGQKAKYLFALEDGRKVGGTPKKRGTLFKVQFRDPAEEKYREAATGVVVPKGWSKSKRPPDAWFDEAEKAIRTAYTPPASGAGGSATTTWEEAEALVLACFEREGSRRTYRSAFRLIRRAFPDLRGPADLTAEQAEQFALAHAAGKYRRTKDDTGAERPRSAEAVRTTLRNLSVLWNRMSGKSLRLVAENVWEEVTRPKKEKRLPRVPPEEAFDKLDEWLVKKFPGPDGKGWPLLQLFIDVKSLAGCRLNDLCQVKSWQFDAQAGSLLITADQDKTNQERRVVLPPWLAARLDKVKGATFLWERYCEDSAVYRPGKRRATVFKPSVLYHAVQSIFREYGHAMPQHKVKTHDFRRRAITLTSDMVGGDMNKVAEAIGVTPETANRHYLDRKRVTDAAEVQRQMAGVLLRWRADQE